ncbi:MAG TPA: ABC transporter permease [Blastococcus sp.]|jgi:ABC-2 type transport system permease protein|nr:ABC transporter permease [Blastococcus sp.]
MTSAVAQEPRAARPAPVLRGYRFELLKLVVQWRVRLLLLACWLGPGVFVAAISRQSSLPTDTLFGRWMGQTGWAGSLVVLSFCSAWVLPLLTSLIAGEVFAAEDRVGTWRHLLTVARSPRRVFGTKALAALTVVVLLAAGLAASSVVGGVAAAGDHPLVGLDGHLLGPGQAAGTVLLAWAAALAPTLAFAAVGLLGSVTLGRSPMGLLLPALLALLLQVVQLLPLPVAVRVALPSYALLAWRGLFTDPAQGGPVVVGVVVSLAWAVTATALAYRLFLRRDFTDLAYDGPGGRVLARIVLPLAALLAVTAGVVAAAMPASGSGIDRSKLQTSMATAYAHLYRLQSRELRRPDVTETELRTTATCDKGGSRVDDVGPGNDWRCVVSWHIPGATAVGSAIYQLDLTADGRYVADGDGPQEVNGFFLVHTRTGDAPNPLWQFDGSVDLLSATSKG